LSKDLTYTTGVFNNPFVGRALGRNVELVNDRLFPPVLTMSSSLETESFQWLRRESEEIRLLHFRFFSLCLQLPVTSPSQIVLGPTIWHSNIIILAIMYISGSMFSQWGFVPRVMIIYNDITDINNNYG
jgi:hypothetical protein